MTWDEYTTREAIEEAARLSEPFDYTKWRQNLDEDLSIEEISKKAMAFRTKNSIS